MSTYKAIIRYHFKRGMEEEGMRFLERELIKKAQIYGCHNLEFLQDEKDHTQIVGIGLWNSLEEAKRFQSHWEAKEHELMKFCTQAPSREFLKIRTMYSDKARKAA